MRHLASKVSGDVILSLHGAQAPTAEEWRAHLELLEGLAIHHGRTLASMRSLVFSDGGMPDSAQRKSSQRVIDGANGHKMPVAIVTSSPFVRGVVTAAHWFGLTIKAFSPAELGAALAYLGIPPARHAALRDELVSLASTLPCQALYDARW